MNDTAELKQLLERQEQRWGQDHPKVIACLESLADLLQMQGRFAEAEPLYWQILKKRHKEFGAIDLKVADTIFDLACLYEQQENWDECERLYKWTCDIRCKLLPKGNAQLESAINKAKEIADRQGHDLDISSFQAAESASQRSSSKFDWASYIEHSRVQVMQGNSDSAEKILKDLVDVAESFEPSTITEAECLHLLGLVHGKAQEAEFLFNWALQIHEALEASEKRLPHLEAKGSLPDLCSVCESGVPSVSRAASCTLDVPAANAESRQADNAKEGEEPATMAQEEPFGKLAAMSSKGEIEQIEEAQAPQDPVNTFLGTGLGKTGKAALGKGDLGRAETMLLPKKPTPQANKHFEADLELAEAALSKAEKEYGKDDIRVSHCMDAIAALLRSNKVRTLDAVNLEATARAIRIAHHKKEKEKDTAIQKRVETLEAVSAVGQRRRKEKITRNWTIVAVMFVLCLTIAHTVLMPTPAEKQLTDVVSKAVQDYNPVTLFKKYIDKGTERAKEAAAAKEEEHNKQVDNMLKEQ